MAMLGLLVLMQIYSYYNRSSSRRRVFLSDDDYFPPSPSSSLMLVGGGSQIDRRHQMAWNQLAFALQASKPATATALRVSQHVPMVSLQQSVTHWPEEEFDAISMDRQTIVNLAITHGRFVNQIQHKLQDAKVYLEGKRGIVMTASRGDLAAALVQLRLLRRTHSNLPVDVFLVSMDDYDAEICETIMTRLNARCRVLEILMDSQSDSPRQVKSMIESRMIRANEPLHKLLALFFSDWEENLMLGFDTLVYNSPDAMFQEEPYLSHGLIMWPDFWASSISPKMNLIQRRRVPNSTDKSSTVDMGQLVLSKSMQQKTLLLAIYYTFFGPDLYHVLLRQSGGGEEGSQAIKAAARFFDAPFFVLKRDVEAVGYQVVVAAKEEKSKVGKGGIANKAGKTGKAKSSSSFHGVAMLQHFALEDYHRQPREQHRPAFIRANNPPLDPLSIMQSSTMAYLQRIAQSSDRHRMWQSFSARHESNGWQNSDPEKAVWDEMKTVACEHLRPIPQYADRSAQACREITLHRSRL